MAGKKPDVSLRLVPDQSFGELLRVKRMGDRLTQAELADRFEDATQQLVGKWERGVAYPSIEYHEALASYIGLAGAAELQNLLEESAAAVSAAKGGGPRVRTRSRVSPDIEALAVLVKAYAKRIEQGENLGPEQLAILDRATAALAESRGSYSD